MAFTGKEFLLFLVSGWVWMCIVRCVTIDEISMLVGGGLSERSTIGLSGMGFTGPIPSELGLLTNLTALDLSNNHLTGSIPPLLGQLVNLKVLDLHNNSLSGAIPIELGQLESLENLDLSYNGLSSPIPPKLGQLAQLNRLSLDNNRLWGVMPPELGQLTGLEHLYLYNNHLSGATPAPLGKLSRLRYLYLQDNNFHGLIPPELGNLANLDYLVLKNNSLSGTIPSELGNMSSLRHLYLYNNNLTGAIPPELGQLTSLQTFDISTNGLSDVLPAKLGQLVSLTDFWLHDNKFFFTLPPEFSQMGNLTVLWLSFNNLSGNIPSQLGNLAKLKDLYLDNNSFSGSIPHELGQLTSLETLTLNGNDLSGPIPSELGSLTGLLDLDLSSTMTSCERVNLSRFQQLRSLGLPCQPPRSAKQTNIYLLQLGLGDQTTEALDLSSLPSSCKIVNLTDPNPRLKRIRFWDACNTGCVVSLRGTGARLLRSTRRHICLHKISVFLDGDLPEPVYDDNQRFTNALKNNKGTYDLTDPNFVDYIDLGPDGRAYTGVGFTRVQAGNLCGNPEAKRVAAIVFGSFAVGLLLATRAIILVARWRRQKRPNGDLQEEQDSRSWKYAGLYVWGAALGVLPVVDLVTDLFVLKEVVGAWPMWVVLASICAPFIVGAYAVTLTWTSITRPALRWSGMRFIWLWPPPSEFSPDSHPARNARAPHRWLLALVLLPFGVVGVLVQDVLAVVGKFGFHLAWGEEVVSFERYHDARVSVEMLLEALPQVVFQTGLYVVGSSRATRIYIDEQIFVQSIVVSLTSLSAQYCNVLWEAVYEGESLVGVLVGRFQKIAGQPFLFTRAALDRSEDEGILRDAGVENPVRSAYTF